jgi:hypothetical protein
MNDEIREANLALLIGLKKHLDDADKLRQQFDRLIKLADPKPGTESRETPRCESEADDGR